MSRDEDLWSNPEAFYPERFLEMDAVDTKSKNPFDMVFGYGRRPVLPCLISPLGVLNVFWHVRLCPGRLFADTTLFLAIANIAATLDIRKALDAEGKEITPTASFHPSFVRSVGNITT